jgi:hypothetical protein
MVYVCVAQLRVTIPVLGIVKIPVGEVAGRRTYDDNSSGPVVIESAIKPEGIRIPVAVWIPGRITEPVRIRNAGVIRYILRVQRCVYVLLCIPICSGVIIGGLL